MTEPAMGLDVDAAESAPDATGQASGAAGVSVRMNGAE
jgi:hypothetical protein